MASPMTLTESYWPATTDGPPLVDMTVGEMLREAAAEAPTTEAVVEGIPDTAARRRWTYGELLVQSERVARALAARFDPGERLGIYAPNIPEWLLVEFGAALAGITLVTVNPAFQVREVAYVLGQSRASGVMVLPEFRGNPMGRIVEEVSPDLPELREVISFADFDELVASAPDDLELPDVSSADPAQIQYTSGTTGFPKGALLHHRGLVNNARLTMDGAGVVGGGYLNPMPMFHTGGCVVGALGSVAARAKHVLLMQFDPGLALELVETESPTFMLGVPTMLIAMMEHPDFTARDLSTLRGVCSGGSLVPADLVRKIEEQLGVHFTILYGQTEASPVATMTRPDDEWREKTETIGRALPHTEIRIVDPVTGETAPVGSTGELCTRGYLVMDGYFEMPERTAEAIDADGWLHTGDLCAMDERGYCTVEGRLKDMIIRGGENIYPKEIEELLFEHPSVAEIAVVGLPDDTWGEIVGAFVRSSGGGPNRQELFAHCREHLAPHKTPKVWVYVDDYPLTASGKIQKFVLRENWQKGLYREDDDG